MCKSTKSIFTLTSQRANLSCRLRAVRHVVKTSSFAEILFILYFIVICEGELIEFFINFCSIRLIDTNDEFFLER